MDRHNRRVLVWGARGFIGRHLVSSLTDDGLEVSVLARAGGRSSLPEWSGRVRWHEYTPERDNRRAFQLATESAAVIFNLAGSSGAVNSNQRPEESLDANCRAQLQFLEACSRSDNAPHVVFASSRLVYAPAGRMPVTEDGLVAPLSFYAAHKLCIEHYHRILAGTGRMTFTICRLSNPFGPERYTADKGYGVINTLIQRAACHLPITLFGNGSQLRDYLYIADAVEALRLCGDRSEARNTTYNVARGVSMALRDVAAIVRARTGAPPIEHLPWPPEHEAVESGDFVADVSKIRRELGFVARHTFDQGLDEMLKTLWNSNAHSRAAAAG